MKADEIFEKLDYKKDEYYTNGYVDIRGNSIHFIERADGYNTIRFYENPDSDQEINMEELQAINLKCKELGWI